jgi:hypothetical protein
MCPFNFIIVLHFFFHLFRLVISLVVARILALKVKTGKKLTVLGLSSVVASTVESKYLGAHGTIQICIQQINIYIHRLIHFLF